MLRTKQLVAWRCPHCLMPVHMTWTREQTAPGRWTVYADRLGIQLHLKLCPDR